MIGQVLFIVWRESVEALLVIGILYTWLSQGDLIAQRGLPYLWGGVAVGILAALALGMALLGFSHMLSDDAQTYFQIAMALVAAGLIVQMVFWMRRHGKTLKQDMASSLQANYESGHWWGIFVLAALAVAREGSETVVFLYGLHLGQQGAGQRMLILAGMLGLILAGLTFYLLQLGGRIFSWRRFFQVTEIILLLLAASLLLNGIEKLIDLLLEHYDWIASIDFISMLTMPVWNSAWLLDDTSMVGGLITTLTGYRAQPELISVIIYSAYWLAVLIALNQSRHVRAKQ